MEKFLKNLKEQAEEQPMLAVTAGVGVLAVVAQVINSVSAAYGRRTWSKEVSRRSRKTR